MAKLHYVFKAHFSFSIQFSLPCVPFPTISFQFQCPRSGTRRVTQFNFNYFAMENAANSICHTSQWPPNRVASGGEGKLIFMFKREVCNTNESNSWVHSTKGYLSTYVEMSEGILKFFIYILYLFYKNRVEK